MSFDKQHVMGAAAEASEPALVASLPEPVPVSASGDGQAQGFGPSRITILLTASLLAGCSDNATCVRKSDGLVMHGWAQPAGGGEGIARYIVRDQNGLQSEIDSGNSNEFDCKVNPS